MQDKHANPGLSASLVSVVPQVTVVHNVHGMFNGLVGQRRDASRSKTSIKLFDVY